MQYLKNAMQSAGKIAALSLLPITAAHAVTVDLLVVYDDFTRRHFNGQPETAMNNWVAQVNSMFQNSQIDVQLRLVGVLPHEESGSDMGAVLGNLRVDSWVLQKRNELGADYVTQIHQTGGCGVGYLAVHRDWAFNLVGPTCGARTMAHEIGHTMGLGHSRKQGDQGGARYRYGLGHGVDGVFGTIMTYPWIYNANPVSKFSNPNILCGGLPCGVPAGRADEADAARAVNNVRSEVAAFLPTRTGGGGGSSTGLANGVYSLKAQHSGRCVDVYGGSATDGAAVIQWSCHQGNNQRWIITSLGNGYHEVKAKHSGKCMDVSANSAATGARLHQWRCHRGGNQQWKIERQGDGSYRFTARHSGKVADISNISQTNGAYLHQWDWLNAGNQKFVLDRLE